MMIYDHLHISSHYSVHIIRLEIHCACVSGADCWLCACTFARRRKEMYGTTIDDEDKEFSSSVEGVNSDGEKYTASENEGRWEKVQRRRRGRRERVWTTTLASLVASIPAVIVGYTIAFSSSALLDLTGDLAPGIPSGYGFSSALSATFAVIKNSLLYHA